MPEKVDLDQWKLRLKSSHTLYDKGIKENLKVWREYYRGDQWASGLLYPDGPYRTATVDNVIFSNLNIIKSSINLRRPKVIVTPKKKPHQLPSGVFFNTIASGALLRLLLDSYYQELRVKEQSDKCVVDGLIGPWGIMEFGYTFKTEKIKDKSLLEVHELIKEDSVFAVRRSPWDLRVDPKAKDHNLRDADWIALRWRMSLDDVKAHPKLKHTADLKPNFKVNLDPNNTGEEYPTLSQNDDPVLGEDADLDQVVGWKIWDKKNAQLLYVVEDHDKELHRGPWPIDFGGGFPVETLWFNYNPDELLPISDVELSIPGQNELNRINSMKLDHIRRISQRGYVAQENTFTEDELKKVQNGADGYIALTNKRPEGALVPVKDANISQDIYIVGGSVKNSIRENLGVAGFEAGESKKFDTAKEPALINAGVQSRRAERAVTIEDFHGRVVRKIAIILQQTLSKRELNLTKNQFDFAAKTVPGRLEKKAVATNALGQFAGIPHKIVERVGDEAQVLLPWLEVAKESIKGEYDFAIEVGSTQLDTEDKKKAEITALYQLLKDNPLVEPVEGLRRLLNTYQVIDPEALIKDPQVAQQQGQQQQAQAVQAEIAKDQPKRTTDLEKTKMKSAVALEQIKSKERIASGQSRTSFLTAALAKPGGKE